MYKVGKYDHRNHYFFHYWPCVSIKAIEQYIVEFIFVPVFTQYKRNLAFYLKLSIKDGLQFWKNSKSSKNFSTPLHCV